MLKIENYPFAIVTKYRGWRLNIANSSKLNFVFHFIFMKNLGLL